MGISVGNQFMTDRMFREAGTRFAKRTCSINKMRAKSDSTGTDNALT
jgi:hypothetical protein